MKLLNFIFAGYVSATTYHHFDLEQADRTIRTKEDFSQCLTLTSKRKIRFMNCGNTPGLKQQWIATQGNYFGKSFYSAHFHSKPFKGKDMFMCVTVGKRGKAKKLRRCQNNKTRGGWPRQLFDMLGDEDQLSIPREDGSGRDCLGVDSNSGKITLGACDASTCNSGRDPAFKCSSCGWRWGHEDKCDYCEDKNHVLTNDGDCIDINSVSTCTEKYPISFTMQTLQWYHNQGQNYCIACDPNDASKCLENACPQRYNTGEWKDGKCGCPENSATIYAQSGGPFVAYAGCANDLPGNKWEFSTVGENWNCMDNSFQLSTKPESRCNKCQVYNSFYCAGCKTKGAVIALTNPGSRMYCKCPDGFTYNSGGDKCVRI